MSSLGLAVQPLGVEDSVHRVRRCALLLARKQDCKSFGILAAALETRPMAGGERRNLVEEEQLRVGAAPHVALAALEFQHAADPPPRHPTPQAERFAVAMKFPPAIAEQSASRGCREEVTERIDPILQRHRWSSESTHQCCRAHSANDGQQVIAPQRLHNECGQDSQGGRGAATDGKRQNDRHDNRSRKRIENATDAPRQWNISHQPEPASADRVSHRGHCEDGHPRPECVQLGVHSSCSSKKPPATAPAIEPATMNHQPGTRRSTATATIPPTIQPQARRAPAHSGTSIAAKNAGITRSNPYRAGSTMKPPMKYPMPVAASQPVMIALAAPKYTAMSRPPSER